MLCILFSLFFFSLFAYVDVSLDRAVAWVVFSNIFVQKRQLLTAHTHYTFICVYEITCDVCLA